MAETVPATSDRPVGDGGGAELAAYIDSELAVERARRSTVEARGASLITTSSAFGTLLFAALALIAQQESVEVPSISLAFVAVAFIAFLAAAGCGVLVGRAPSMTVVKAEQLLAWRNDDGIWRNSSGNVRWLLVRAKILTLSSLRVGTTRMARWAIRGWVAVLVALLALAVAAPTMIVSLGD